MIDITGTDLREFIAKAYELSIPQGLGNIHFRSGLLDNGTIDDILKITGDNHAVDGIVLSMDYVIGRAVKMTVHRKGGRYVISDRWFDHTGDQLLVLLHTEGVVNNGTYKEPTE